MSTITVIGLLHDVDIELDRGVDLSSVCVDVCGRSVDYNGYITIDELEYDAEVELEDHHDAVVAYMKAHVARNPLVDWVETLDIPQPEMSSTHHLAHAIRICKAHDNPEQRLYDMLTQIVAAYGNYRQDVGVRIGHATVGGGDI